MNALPVDQNRPGTCADHVGKDRVPMQQPSRGCWRVKRRRDGPIQPAQLGWSPAQGFEMPTPGRQKRGVKAVARLRPSCPWALPANFRGTERMETRKDVGDLTLREGDCGSNEPVDEDVIQPRPKERKRACAKAVRRQRACSLRLDDGVDGKEGAFAVGARNLDDATRPRWKFGVKH